MLHGNQQPGQVSQHDIAKGPHEYVNGEYVKRQPKANDYPRHKYFQSDTDAKGKAVISDVLVASEAEELALGPGYSDYPDMRNPSRAPEPEPTKSAKGSGNSEGSGQSQPKVPDFGKPLQAEKV